MTDSAAVEGPGWYYAHGDPPGTHRYWDGSKWVGVPIVAPPNPMSAGDGGAPASADDDDGGGRGSTRHSSRWAASGGHGTDRDWRSERMSKAARTAMFSKRVGGFLVDSAAYGTVLIAGFLLVGVAAIIADRLASMAIFWFVLPPFSVTGFAFNYWNQVIRVEATGSSLGKRAVNTALVDRDSGALVGTERLIVRFVVLSALWWLPWWAGVVVPWIGFVLAPIWLVAAVDSVWPLWDDHGQRLVDKLVNTKVVSRLDLEPDS